MKKQTLEDIITINCLITILAFSVVFIGGMAFNGYNPPTKEQGIGMGVCFIITIIGIIVQIKLERKLKKLYPENFPF